MTREFTFRYIVYILSFYTLVYITPVNEINSYTFIFVTALILLLLNLLVRPFLLLLALPINILTFGLFTIVIDACMIMLSNIIISGFLDFTFWYALIIAVFINLYRFLLKWIFSTEETQVQY